MRRQKDLEAARKAGTAPAAVDSNGNAINPHIPNYITKAPWYSEGVNESTLDHHRLQKEEKRGHEKFDEWYDRGARAGPAAKKYRKGACENCGAMSHKKQDCVERPRKKGAKFTNKNIMADELVQKFDGDYDAKRDRWNGYDPAAYRSVVDEYEAAEAARQKYREEEIDKQTSTDEAAIKKAAKKEKKVEDDDFGSSDEEEENEDKYADAADQVGQSLDTKNRITVRNLRLREDTAKYLINLDGESAHYDPKTRSMRDAPDASLSLEEVSILCLWLICDRASADVLLSKSLPETTLPDTLVMRQTSRSCRRSLGSLHSEAIRSSWRQTRQQENCCTRNTWKRRMYSKTQARPQSWQSTAESNTWSECQKSCYLANRRLVSHGL